MMWQMYQLWAVRVDTGNGKELYGEDYADVFVINRMHYKAAASSICDHVRSRLMWLHAIYLSQAGRDRTDTTCNTRIKFRRFW